MDDITYTDAFVIGTVSSALFGYIAVRWMINY
ncbi:hypothetical protein HNR78_000396 [Parageobacillus toebii NBRC 107807]|uniref:Uncharacterized protein n=1 Tax=Parageobacillus toebii NBRC 107807 TaxID=1223503 RepID=A0AA89SSA4_9BACL|nr:hypothetical protein [Parageobacillus toebii NBRC 107807]